MPLSPKFRKEFDAARKDVRQRMKLILPHTKLILGRKSDPGPWLDETEQSIQKAKEQLAVMERLIQEAKQQYG
jgi:hypothetical protein